MQRSARVASLTDGGVGVAQLLKGVSWVVLMAAPEEGKKSLDFGLLFLQWRLVLLFGTPEEGKKSSYWRGSS